MLGPLEAVGPGGARAVHGERQRTLLAALLAARGETVAADSIVELLWGDAVPDNPSAALHSQVSRLRRSLADVLSDGCDLVTRTPGYALTVGTDDVDATWFENGVLAARSARTEDAVRLYDDALSLWRGAAYGEFADVLPAYLEGIRLDELRLTAVEERARVLVDLGRSASVVPALEAFVVANPLRETARVILMRALYATGLHTKALSLYQDYRERLAEELGLEPSVALQRLQAEILNHSLERCRITSAADSRRDGPAGRGRPGRAAGPLFAACWAADRLRDRGCRTPAGRGPGLGHQPRCHRLRPRPAFVAARAPG